MTGAGMMPTTRVNPSVAARATPVPNGTRMPVAGASLSPASPVYSVTVDATVREVATLMFERKVNPVPVLNHLDQVVGIVSRSDIVRLLAEVDAPLSAS